ncbi:TRAM domain-containing protein, partial [Casaltella massiliensis]|nr:TRAM domain-containing protein [Casaltella massiliensis]
EINKSYEGKVVEVLVEGKSKTDENKFTGRTRQNKLVNFESDVQDIIGTLVNVKILDSRTFSLNGVIEK